MRLHYTVKCRATVRMAKIKMREFTCRGENALKCSNKHWMRRKDEIAMHAKYLLQYVSTQTNQMGQSSNCRVATLQIVAFFSFYLLRHLTTNSSNHLVRGVKLYVSHEIGKKRFTTDYATASGPLVYMPITYRRLKNLFGRHSRIFRSTNYDIHRQD